MRISRLIMAFGLLTLLFNCTNQVAELNSTNDVTELNSRLEVLSELSIDECLKLLDEPYNMEVDSSQIINLSSLIERDYLKYRVGLITVESFSLLINATTATDEIIIPNVNIIPKANRSNNKSCSVSKVGFHMESTIAIKFNSDGRFNYSDMLSNQPKSFWGTWKQDGNQIITTNDRSTNGRGIGQVNTYTYDCIKLTIGGFTLVKD